MSTIYDDGRYLVSATTFSTPTRLYPLAHSTATVRRDLQWLTLGTALVAVAAFLAYGDLLMPIEKLVIGGIPVATGLLAINMGILALDAPGHRRTLIVARAKTIRKIFAALRTAKGAENSQSLMPEQVEMDFGK